MFLKRKKEVLARKNDVIREVVVSDGACVSVVTLLGAKDSAEPLSFLSSRAAMRRDLDEDVCLGQVKGRVTHLREGWRDKEFVYLLASFMFINVFLIFSCVCLLYAKYTVGKGGKPIFLSIS